MAGAARAAEARQGEGAAQEGGGDQADGKWTLKAEGDEAVVAPGRPTGVKADCVLKTDIKTFTRIVRDGYVPSFAEFTDGRVKTNDPNLLMKFKSAFGL